MSTIPYITVSKPLIPKTQSPLDYRAEISTISAMPNIINAYVGLIVYVKSENQHYKIISLTQNTQGQQIPSEWAPMGTIWEDEE